MDNSFVPNREKAPGKFIAFEGIDGSGKSTQAALLAGRLRQEGIPCHVTMEPTGAPIGSLIRQVLTGRLVMDSRAVAGLFAADRLDHLLNGTDGILHMINEGITVVTDRYYFSSYAYHSVDMPMEWVIKINEQSSALLRPAVTVFLDVSPQAAMDRIARNRTRRELYEKESRLTKVRENYMRAFALLGKEERYITIAGEQPEEKVAGMVWEAVKGYFDLER